MEASDLKEISVSKSVAVGTTDTKIGDDINTNKVRYIWRITASADDGSEQNVTLYAGDSSDAEREIIGVVRTPDSTNFPANDLGGDIRNPLIIVRPRKTLSSGSVVTTYNQIYAKADISTVNLIVDYYDA